MDDKNKDFRRYLILGQLDKAASVKGFVTDFDYRGGDPEFPLLYKLIMQDRPESAMWLLDQPEMDPALRDDENCPPDTFAELFGKYDVAEKIREKLASRNLVPSPFDDPSLG